MDNGDLGYLVGLSIWPVILSLGLSRFVRGKTPVARATLAVGLALAVIYALELVGMTDGMRTDFLGYLPGAAIVWPWLYWRARRKMAAEQQIAAFD